MSSESTDNSSGAEAEVLDTISEVFYGGGCLATPPDRRKAMPIGARLLSTAALPVYVDLTEGNEDFPPVGNQGRQNSCVGWAIAYAIKTYLKQVEKKWGSKTPEHQFSPAFIYNQLNTSPEKYGGPIDLQEAMDLVEAMGVCTLKDMPYDSESHTTMPNAVQKEVARWYKSQAYEWLGNDVTTIKACLSNRIPVLIRLPLWESFRVMNPLEPVYRNQNVATNDGHAVCLVGYYDNYKNSGTGVFKFINSWGKGWWESGYGYVTYDLIEKQTAAVVQAYYMLDKVYVESVSLNYSNMELVIGESQALISTVLPANASNQKVNYTTDNSNIAAVDAAGKVSARSPGETTIRVYSNDEDSNATATCYVKVKDINDSLFMSDTIPDKMTAGKTYRVSITLRNTGITNWVATTLGSTGNYCLGTDVNNDSNGPLFLNGANRVAFTSGTSISPNSIATVTFQMKAPTATGTYKLNFKMLKEQAVWFGDVLKRNIVVIEATDQPVFNTYGSIGTFKNNQLRNYSHDVIKEYKLKNRHIELYDFIYSTMRTYTHNQLREGDL